MHSSNFSSQLATESIKSASSFNDQYETMNSNDLIQRLKIIETDF
jgi:hypothetical protein